MKIKLLFTVSVLYCLTVFSQTVVTNDFAFESYLETLAEAQGQGNVANNNEVIFSDLSTITTISAPSLGIVDLTGLERFTALTLLELQNNNITTLVRAEGLTLLQTLRAFNCDIQGLVDFSLLVNLGVVGLDDNQISSITLPTSASLGILDIRNSSLSVLDLTNKPNITQLAVSGNQLTFLDISVIDDLQQFRTCDNVGLSCIQVTQAQFDNLAAITSSLTCPSNGTLNNNVGGWLFDDTITQFGTNPTCVTCTLTPITDLAFETFLESAPDGTRLDLNGVDVTSISDGIVGNGFVCLEAITQIVTMNASGEEVQSNTPPGLGITSLSEIAVFTDLEFLRAEGNDLTTINLGQNFLLKEAYVYNNQLMSIELGNINLEALGVTNNNLIQVDISSSTDIQKLDIENNPNFTSLILPASSSGQLNRLFLNDIDLTDLDISGVDQNLTNFRILNNDNLGCIKVSNEQTAITRTNASQYQIPNDDTSVFRESNCSNGIVVVTNDFAFESYLETLAEAQGQGNVANNNEVIFSDLSTITTISAPSLGIVDLTGLERFTALTLLELQNNNITTLVRAEGLTLLQTLRAFNCDIQGLVDFSLLVNLGVVGLDDNQISSITLPTSASLGILDIRNSSLSVLDLTNKPNITQLAVSGNQLTFLDISVIDDLQQFRTCDNVGLSCIQVTQAQFDNLAAITSSLTCPSNGTPNNNVGGWLFDDTITQFGTNPTCSNGIVVVTNDFAFESYLETLAEAQGQGNVANNNEVIFSDLSTITTISAPSLGIVDLTGLERFTALTLLELQNNNITTLVRAEGLTLLQTLRAFNCDIQGLVDFSLLVNLGVVGLDDNQISSITLPTSASLGILDIRNSSLSVLDLTNKPNITQLAVSGNQLTFLDISVIDDLQQFRTCDNVGLSCIQVTQAQFDNLAAITSSLTCPSNGTLNNNVGGWLFDDTITQFGTNPTCTSIEVTIVATDSDAFENPLDNGEFEVRLNQVNTTGEDIIINYMVAGSAIPNQDYQTLTGTVAIANGESINVIPVIPIDDPESEGIETIEVTLTADMAYGVGTPNTAIVNITSEDTVSNEGPNLGPNDISVMVLSNSCPGVANGSILVTTQQNLNFNILFDNNQVGTLSSSASFSRENLAQGTYDVCLTLAEFQNWERCFTVVVEGLSELNLVGFKVIEASKVANLKVSGSKTYVVNVNGKQYNFNSLGGALGTTSIQIPIKVGLNDISVRGESQCQGVLGQKLFLGDLRAYPNPVVDNLQIVGLENNEEVNLIITNLAGQVIFNGNDKSINGKINIDFTTMNSGVYLIFYESATMAKQFKILKR